MTRIALITALLAGAAQAQETPAAEPATEVEIATVEAMDMTPLDAWLENRALGFEAVEIDLDDFKWRARPVVVFADTPADPAFQRQVELLEARLDDLIERDIVVIVDTDPEARSDIRTKLRPRGFMLAIIGKDGGVKLRKPFPWDVREITRSVDKMPMRQQEIRDRRDQGT